MGRSLTVRPGTSRKKILLFVVGCIFPGVAGAQVTEPIPPPDAPGTVVTNMSTATGIVRAKATPDECWTGLGQNTKYDFINQQTPQTPCDANQIPKVDQGYIWGQVLVGNQLFFGTFANAECVGQSHTGNLTPFAITGAYGCEYSESPYALGNGGLLPATVADFRPPRMYVYDVPSHTIRDITPKLGGSPPAAVCGPQGIDPLCNDLMWNQTQGIRSAVAYTEPTTGNIYVIVSGPAQDVLSVNFFVWGVTENRWVAKYPLYTYYGLRRWVLNQGVLYAAAFKATAAGGGSLLRYTGNFSVIPTATPRLLNLYDSIPTCGTGLSAPVPGSPSCIAFEDVGDFDTPSSEVVAAPDGVADAGRLFVGTWAPRASNPNQAVAGIYMSPVVPPGGLTAANAGQWTKVWDASNYEPDPLIKITYGVGALSFFNGYLYWGTLNPPVFAINIFFQTYGQPTDHQTVVTDVLRAYRTAALLRAQNFSTGTPSIQLLYGEANLSVYSPATATWQSTPNNVPSGTCITACGTPGLYGHSGFGNVWTNYIWSMGVINSRLYVGTMNWEFLAFEQGMAGSTTVPQLPLQPSKFGAGLYYFADNTSAGVPVSTNGLGNFLNYGVRNIIPYNPTAFFVGTANPMNLATTGTTNLTGAACEVSQCRGGWELIEIDPTN
jgi:hypothetical protein